LPSSTVFLNGLFL